MIFSQNYSRKAFLTALFILSLSLSFPAYILGEIDIMSIPAPEAISLGGIDISDFEFFVFGEGDSPTLSFDGTTQIGNISTSALKISDIPLNYPNPWRISSGTELQYTLNDDAEINMLVFNMAAHQVSKITFKSGFPGGSSGINNVNLTKSDFGDIPGGLYYYLLLHDETILAKGKMVVTP